VSVEKTTGIKPFSDHPQEHQGCPQHNSTKDECQDSIAEIGPVNRWTSNHGEG
jgi:hypothetical protein